MMRMPTAKSAGAISSRWLNSSSMSACSEPGKTARTTSLPRPYPMIPVSAVAITTCEANRTKAARDAKYVSRHCRQKYAMTANIVPVCRRTSSRVSAGAEGSRPMSFSATTTCAELETGSSSARPWMMASTTTWIGDMTVPWGSGRAAGAAVARHYSSHPPPRQPSKTHVRHRARTSHGLLRWLMPPERHALAFAPRAEPTATDGIEVVLFDVGGVLLEVHGIAAIMEWLEHRVTPEEVWGMWLASPVVRAFESGRIDEAEFAAGILAELRLAMPVSAFLDSFVTWPVRLYPGAPELIARIPSRYRRAVLSNTNAVHWPRIVEELGLGASFEQCFASHLIGKIKPDAQAFEHAVE